MLSALVALALFQGGRMSRSASPAPSVPFDGPLLQQLT
jgi:hypothetical protein